MGVRYGARRLLMLTLAVLGLVTGVGEAHAAPFLGTGQAPRGDATSSAHREAVERARKAALEAALESVASSVSVDPAARARVLDAPAPWTGAFRVLEATDDGATVEVEVEVEIDLQRLIKHVRKRDRAAEPGAFYGLQRAAAVGCPEGSSLEAEVERELADAGIIGPGAATGMLIVEVRCELEGPVRYTHLRAAQVQVTAKTPALTLSSTGTGFAQTQPQASTVALQQALAPVSKRLQAHRRGEVLVHVRPPAPAAHVRRLMRHMERSVLGVQSVVLDGIDGDGSIRLRVSTDRDVRDLAANLATLNVRGFSVRLLGRERSDALVLGLD